MSKVINSDVLSQYITIYNILEFSKFNILTFVFILFAVKKNIV